MGIQENFTMQLHHPKFTQKKIHAHKLTKKRTAKDVVVVLELSSVVSSASVLGKKPKLCTSIGVDEGGRRPAATRST